ncbi:hypothetical protein [Streptococcus anginosus]
MEYINTKTGATISTNGKINGGNWEPVEETKKPAKKAKSTEE